MASSSNWNDRHRQHCGFVETTWVPRLKEAEKIRRAQIRKALDEIHERRALAQLINDPLFPGEQ